MDSITKRYILKENITRCISDSILLDHILPTIILKESEIEKSIIELSKKKAKIKFMKSKGTEWYYLVELDGVVDVIRFKKNKMMSAFRYNSIKEANEFVKEQIKTKKFEEIKREEELKKFFKASMFSLGLLVAVVNIGTYVFSLLMLVLGLYFPELVDKIFSIFKYVPTVSLISKQDAWFKAYVNVA